MTDEPIKQLDGQLLTTRQAAEMCSRFDLGGPDDLPAPGTRIALMESKARVVAAMVNGLIDRDSACERYRITPMELRVWRVLVEHSSFFPA
jgi:hypothetical protein